ncbi:MAG: hypothetical protein PVH82_03100 [Desulfobacteraceae bacterium]
MRYFRSVQIMLGVFAVALLPLQISARVEDVRGWNEARWGMTERDIEKVFKGRVEQRRDPIIDKQEGIYVSQEINDLTFANTKFTVSFVMDEKTNQLREVVLTPKGSHFRVLFELLEKKLVTKYGPVTFRDKEDVDMERLGKNGYGQDQISRVWRFPSTLITLEYWVYGLGSGRVDDGVTLIYKENVKSRAKR